MRINDDFIKDVVDDECVLVPTGDYYQNGAFVLNETAEEIFDLLNENKSRDEIVAALSEEYDSDMAEITAFVDEYLAELQQNGILIDD